jgi:hypothetical protein
MMVSGTLRLHRAAEPPWQYWGELHLPSGRYARIEARVAEDASGKFFELRGGLEPGMSATELEAALVALETNRAEAARHQLKQTDELPF